jgi:8-oxo-dGTP pyrophosphatase MutT (NUDIX family)
VTVADRISAALGRRVPRSIVIPGLARAGVLVAVLERETGPAVLFTQRTQNVSHPGQISFAGGHFEAGEDARAAALREASEEVGLAPASVRVLGQLDDRISITRVIVSPVVGVVSHPPAAFSAQEREVMEIFEVPLERLLDARFYREELREATGVPPGWTEEDLARLSEGLRDLEPGGTHFRVSFFDGGEGRIIWGLTARILEQLLDVAFRAAA